MGGGAYGHPPPPIPLHTLSGSQGSHVPLLGDTGPPLPLLRFLEPMGTAETAPPPSDITSLHEPPDAWVPPPNSWVPPPNSWVPPPNSWVPPLPFPPLQGALALRGGFGGKPPAPPPLQVPR
ncbi:uncharacterized protein LOC135576964 [Columba livia]|uniref:uncharacterized protein LOC135576964 n=1 Tax=Columba livia TaxID=8932 RepID=UPI0031BA9F2B